MEKTTKRHFFTDLKMNAVALMIYIVFMLLISPVFPGVTWFRLGDFTLDVVNYYHGVMIPLALLIIIISAKVFKLPKAVYNFIQLTTYPIILLSFLGLVLFYPTSAALADEGIQTLRDVIMVLDAVLLIIGLLVFPFKYRKDFKSVFAGYLLVIIAAISATIAAVFGMVYEYGNLFTYSAIPFFNSYVNSIGGISTVLGNLITSHSHQMLPAIMGGIVGLTAVIFGYHKLSSGYKWIVSIGLIVSVIGIISMSYLYWISSFGTYVIPAIFTSGPGGMNGLALDDSQTGIVGIGAIIALIGLIKTLDTQKGTKYAQITAVGTWVAAMAAMIGVGYVMEFNEAYYGFGSPGTPPAGGPGYMYDMAYTDGHLLYVFFMLVIAAAFFAILFYFARNNEKKLRGPSYFAIAGMVFGFEGLLVYVLTLSWIAEAIGLWLLFISFAYVVWSLMSTKSADYIPI
ncbi:MAG: hypothetical protein ACP5NO_06530 [Thermoplasmata archaeon]